MSAYCVLLSIGIEKEVEMWYERLGGRGDKISWWISLERAKPLPLLHSMQRRMHKFQHFRTRAQRKIQNSVGSNLVRRVFTSKRKNVGTQNFNQRNKVIHEIWIEKKVLIVSAKCYGATFNGKGQVLFNVFSLHNTFLEIQKKSDIIFLK